MNIMICMLEKIHYFCWCVGKLQKNVLKTLSFYPLKFLSALGLAWQAASKKTEVKSELLTDIDVILMVDEGIREGICHVIHRYAKANNKYIKD